MLVIYHSLPCLKTEYRKARDHYVKASDLLTEFLRDPRESTTFKLDDYLEYDIRGTKLVSTAKTKKAFSGRRGIFIENIEDLDFFMKYFQDSTVSSSDRKEDKRNYGILYLAACALPIFMGDVALAMGDYATAVQSYLNAIDPKIIVGLGDVNYGGTYDSRWYGGVTYPRELYVDGNLPYTFTTGDESSKIIRKNRPDVYSLLFENLSAIVFENLIHPMEDKFFRLRLGNAMLEWADSFYRTDDHSNLARARELYKSVLYLHNETPPIDPDWNLPSEGPFTPDSKTEVGYVYTHDRENPAKQMAITFKKQVLVYSSECTIPRPLPL